MRNGSAALFPLLLAVMSLFWFIWFMGGAADNLHKVNEVEDLQHLQERLLSAAMQKYIDEIQTDTLVDETVADKKDRAVKKARVDIKSIMFDNEVDDKREINE